MKQLNCTFEKVEILPHKIGYLKLNSFPDPGICGAIAHASLEKMNQANVIIFDLRDNTGGQPEMVAKMAATLFDRPVPWYNPRATPSASTLSPEPGSKLADKPVYILTSSRTYSGAEHFTYDLKMLKRASVVGETTGGAAHSAPFHRIDDHFGIGIPESRPASPYGVPDWAVRGVEPDVAVKAADALTVAKQLSLKVHKR
jgi:C-terminal processing protease CtpA/Prc